LAVAGLALGVSPAWSAEVWLDARPLIAADYPADYPTALAAVPKWGYASCDSSWTCGLASIPGPQLVVPAGDTSLTIHLRNSLPITALNGTTPLSVPNMTSIVIPGLREDAMTPAMFPAETNPHGTGQPDRLRMRSFTHETNQGSIGDYIWSNLKPGTYLYHSGTHAQVQVQMGLYGSVKADAAVGQAYLGQAYSSEATLLFSEIDPLLHTEVANATYGTLGHPTSTITYQPKYFLMNGAPYSTTTLPIQAGQAGQRVLLRLLNAGLESHVATLLGGHFQVIAEDGNALAHGRDQYETLLPAGKTMDAIWVPGVNGTYPIYDRRNRQGMLAKLEIGPGAAAAPIAVSDAYSTPVNTPLTVAAPGVLVNDTNPTAHPMTATLVTSPASGTLVLNQNGSFTYTPATAFFGQVAFTYKANNGTDSNVATVTIRVNRPPVAVNDAATTQPNTAVTVNVLANDSDPENQPLTITGVTQGTNGVVAVTPTAVVYTPNTNFTGSDTFTYTISDGQVPTPGTATGTVTVTVVGNLPPIANPDNATVAEDGTVTISVRANDSDPENQPLAIIAVTQGTNGTVTTNGTTVAYKPGLNFNGADTFTYTISDGQLPTPGTATGTVNVTVTPVNDAPVAVANTYAVNKQISFTIPASGVLANDIDVDGNSLTAVQRSNPSGTVSLSADGSFTYTTTAGYVGTRVFKYRANDGSRNSADVNVTLTKDLTVTSITIANNGNWVIRGKSTKPNTTVEVFASPTTGTNSIGTATVGGNGTWTRSVASSVLSSGQQISVSATYAQLIEVPVP
jgi:FtsP/CotA-like multicopper oxidase with cupredoxin domain